MRLFSEHSITQYDHDAYHLKASTLPTETEAKSDFSKFLSSTRTLIKLLLTSSAFRILISDILKTAREIAADVAADIQQVAAKIEITAEVIEETMRPDESGTELPRYKGESLSMPDHFKTDPNRTARDITLDRFESVSLS